MVRICVTLSTYRLMVSRGETTMTKLSMMYLVGPDDTARSAALKRATYNITAKRDNYRNQLESALRTMRETMNQANRELMEAESEYNRVMLETLLDQVPLER